MNDDLIYFNNNALAQSVWSSKYAMKNKQGEQLEKTPLDLHKREAREFARIEKKYGGVEELPEHYIVELFDRFSSVIPQGSVMSILGNPFTIGSLSNCIVLPPALDSYGGIFFTDQQTAQVMKRRCGVGLDISKLRPKGTNVSNAAQTSTGAVSFMHRFSNTCREVAQDGRRGAEMISLHINHPESEEFALVKQDLTKVTGANISLKITDEFMNAVEKNDDFYHRFPIEFNNIEYIDGLTRKNGIGFDDSFPKIYDQNIEVPNTLYYEGSSEDPIACIAKRVKAQNLWKTIVKCAHNTAEPGLLFWDRQHIYSTSSLYPEFENVGTNPCAEIAMNNDSCRLISKNIMSCVVNPFTKEAYFDYDKWYKICYETMRLMDDLVDLELESIENIIEKILRKDTEPDYIKSVELQTWRDLYKSAVRGRRTGAGFTALGDALAALNINYNSDKGIEEAQNIARVKFTADLDSSIDMAEERGAFPAFDAELESKWAEDPSTMFHMIKTEFPERWERMQKIGRRNISWSTVAPNGSLSLLALIGSAGEKSFFGTTSGIEPLFAVYHIRKKKIIGDDPNARIDEVDALGDKWQYFPVFHEGFKMWWVIASQYQHNPEKAIEILESLSQEELQEVIKKSPYANATASEINWKKRIDMQAAIQKYITHSISSTINLPKNVSVDEVSDIYFYAWKAGLKGITIYRDGSRSGVLVTDTTKKKDEEFHYHDAPKRPKELKADFHTVTVKGQAYGVTVGFLNDKPYEIFAFRNGIGFKKSKGVIVKESKGEYHYIPNNEKEAGIANLQEAAIHADEQMLTRLVSGMMRHGVNPKFIIEQIDKCPLEIVSFGKALSRVIRKYVSDTELQERAKCKDCGSTNLIFEEGCSKCRECGSSKCG